LLLRPHNVLRSKKRRARTRKLQQLTADEFHLFLLKLLRIAIARDGMVAATQIRTHVPAA
jgi:hypothetical protein